MLIVHAAWVTHIVHNSFSSYILHSPLSIFCVSILSPPLCSLSLTICFFLSFLSNKLYYAVLSCTLYSSPYAIANKCRLCIEQKVLTNSLNTHRLLFTLLHFTSRVLASFTFSTLYSSLLYLCIQYTFSYARYYSIEELQCAWVRYWLRFRVCLCQVYVRHKSARFYILRFLLLRRLLLLLPIFLFAVPLLRPALLISIHFISSSLFHYYLRCLGPCVSILNSVVYI